jgi:hypothetical protein
MIPEETGDKDCVVRKYARLTEGGQESRPFVGPRDGFGDPSRPGPQYARGRSGVLGAVFNLKFGRSACACGIYLRVTLTPEYAQAHAHAARTDAGCLATARL